ncbi:MAG: hypothetical protein OEO83_17555 [Alphaproteobacteria bacterium]|nr:hypothetical protein [Alphaproteobacteria bacterium]
MRSSWGRAVAAALTVTAIAGCEITSELAGNSRGTRAGTEPVEKAPPPTIKQAKKPKKKPSPAQPVQSAPILPQAAKGPPKPTGPDSKTLVGKNEVELKDFLGPPKAVRNEPPAMVWSYQARECNLDVFLYFDVGQKKFRTLAYRFFPETRVTQVERECLAEIRSARPKTEKKE